MSHSQDKIPLEIQPHAADQLRQQGVPVFDLRPASERLPGMVSGAQLIDADEPLSALEHAGVQPCDPLLVCCGSGVRSLALVRKLRESGYSAASSICGGYAAWRTAGLASDVPDGMDDLMAERYARHLAMPQVGPHGQQKLGAARVLVVGAGGLGCPAAFYLAAAGVGRLGIVDSDRVERSNLQRQILHTDKAVGEAKVLSAQARLTALNPQIDVVPLDRRLDDNSVGDLMAGWDLVIDGSDNFPTRFLVNDACVKRGVPLVYGAVTAFSGQVSVFHPAHQPEGGPCYRCLVSQHLADAGVPDCNVSGVLGVLPGLVGLLQATEAIKLLLGLGQPLIGEVLLVDALSMQFRKVRLRPDPDCPACARHA